MTADINLTREELALIEHFHTANNMFGQLPAQRPGDMQEFGLMCQRLQDFVAARPSYRRIQVERNLPQN